jgi:hypothetical protein
MKMNAVWLGLAPVVVAAPLALAHCSSSSGSPGSGSSGSGSGGGSGSGASSGGGSGGESGGSTGSGTGSVTGSGAGTGVSSGSSGSGDDGGGNPDASASGAGDGGGNPPACMSVDGGAQCSSPLMVACGSSTCNTSTEYCCVDTNIADGGQTQTCVPPNGTCSTTATTIHCDEAADCAGGAVCCGNFPRPGVQGNTSCLASCTGFQSQLCRTDSECGTNSDAGALQKCVLQTCGSTTLQLCAVMGFGLVPDAGSTGVSPGCTAK